MSWNTLYLCSPSRTGHDLFFFGILLVEAIGRLLHSPWFQERRGEELQVTRRHLAYWKSSGTHHLCLGLNW
jgi:hypothetical protein